MLLKQDNSQRSRNSSTFVSTTQQIMRHRAAAKEGMGSSKQASFRISETLDASLRPLQSFSSTCDGGGGGHAQEQGMAAHQKLA